MDEPGTTPFVTVTAVIVVLVPMQVPVVNSKYVTEPLAWKLPVSVAESVTDWPTVIVVGESVVAIVGLALFTAKGSHVLVVPALLASPLYTAFQL